VKLSNVFLAIIIIIIIIVVVFVVVVAVVTMLPWTMVYLKLHYQHLKAQCLCIYTDQSINVFSAVSHQAREYVVCEM
jgi:flagellar basal body-associated protein FliL